MNCHNIFRFIAGLFILMILFSCEKFKDGQNIPSYIRIDSVILKNNPQVESGNYFSQNFTDIWVYVDDQSIGAFELRGTKAEDPLIIPVLVQGQHKLSIYAGIKLNGIAATRLPYPMVQPVIYDDFLFTVDSITKVTPFPAVSYYESCTFAWIEEFEDGSISLDETNNSDTSITSYQHSPPGSILGYRSGIAWVDEEKPVFEVISTIPEVPGFVLPSSGQPVLLEIDYNINVPMAVGILIRRVNIDNSQHPVLVLSPTNGEWNKVYVNFTAVIGANPAGDYYNIYFRAEHQSSVEVGEIKIDNLKLIYRG